MKRRSYDEIETPWHLAFRLRRQERYIVWADVVMGMLIGLLAFLIWLDWDSLSLGVARIFG